MRFCLEISTLGRERSLRTISDIIKNLIQKCIEQKRYKVAQNIIYPVTNNLDTKNVCDINIFTKQTKKALVYFKNKIYKPQNKLSGIF